MQALRALLEELITEGQEARLQQAALAFIAEQVAAYVSSRCAYAVLAVQPFSGRAPWIAQMGPHPTSCVCYCRDSAATDEVLTGALSELMQAAMARSQVCRLLPANNQADAVHPCTQCALTRA
jgi:hypothetical protein